MKTLLTIMVLIILSLPANGNDGVYMTRGGIIYPVKETKVALDKEVLSFTVRDKICHVDIYFEFNNPEKTERTLLVGFQAPSALGDVEGNVSNSVQIYNFRILNEGKILPYQLKVAECEDCELKDTGTQQFSQMEGGIYVYLFEVVFKPGVNRIHHSYSFPASTSVVFNQIYNYILTTGAKWAGGKIKDLTVQVDMGRDKYFYVTDIFGPKADWMIIGSGKISSKGFVNYKDSCRMVRVLSGKLQVSVKDFKPEKDIDFGIINEYSFISIPTDFEGIKQDKILGLGDLTLQEEYSREDLRLLRNTVYAQYGYVFKSKDLQDYFSQFEWYMPDPNLAMRQIILTDKERKFIDEIVKRENE